MGPFLQGPWALVIPMTETVYSSGGFAIVSREPLAEAASGRVAFRGAKRRVGELLVTEATQPYVVPTGPSLLKHPPTRPASAWRGPFLQGPWALVIPMTETVYSSGGFAIVSREPLAEAASGRVAFRGAKRRVGELLFRPLGLFLVGP